MFSITWLCKWLVHLQGIFSLRHQIVLGAHCTQRQYGALMVLHSRRTLDALRGSVHSAKLWRSIKLKYRNIVHTKKKETKLHV